MNRRYIKYFLLSFLSVVGACVLFNAIVDPLQYYRCNPSYPLCENDRWQVASFISNFTFDTAVVGTSLTQNFSCRKIKEKLGGTPIKLSIAGATIPEQILVLEAALKSGKLKKVIWGIDRYYFYSPEKIKDSMPIFLYNRNFDAHIRYLVNLDMLAQGLRVVVKRTPTDAQEALESYNSWWKDATFSKEIILKLYKDELSKGKRKYEPRSEMRRDLLNNILRIVRAHPNVEFIFFFPPYSLAYHKKEYHLDQAGYHDDAQFRRVILQEMININNVKIFDFETDLNIIADLDNYKDLNHYGKQVNDYIVDCIADKKYLVTEKNIDTSQANFHQLPHQVFK